MPRTQLTALLTILTLSLTLGHYAAADVIVIREGGGDGIIDATFDDTFVNRNSGTLDTNYGSVGELWARRTESSTNTNNQVALLAVKDLFDLLPAVNEHGHVLQITSATLTLRRTAGGASDIVSVSRMIVDWLPGAAGTNESLVTYNRMNTDTDTPWPQTWNSAMDGYPKENSIFTIENQATANWTDTSGPVDIDITALLADIYEAEANYGFAIVSHNALASNVRFNSSEAATPANRPMLTIEYEYIIPEPGSLALLGLGASLVFSRRRWRA